MSWCKILQYVTLFQIFYGTVECWFKLPNGQEDPYLQVGLPTGTIQGVQLKTDRGLDYYAYRGVPFAAPPVGDLRFRAPQEVPAWDGILDATEDGAACYQLRSDTDDESEDCLFINVYTTLGKQQRDTMKQPVMVWIYGGAFVSGHSKSNMYGPDYLLEKDVIVVTFNYRVGIFGFLSTEDHASPGNYGLKDQLAALRWVNRNIHHFGGDNNNVTIFGESAGAASISYLMLMPQASGLFHKAISESGSALCPWAMQRNPLAVAFQVGHSMGILTLSSDVLINALRQQTVQALMIASTSPTIANVISPLNGLVFSPTIEPEHPDAVITEGPHELFRQGRFNRVPYIIGFNSEESAVLQEMLDYLRVYLLSYDVLPTNLVPEDMHVPKLSLNYVDAGYKIKLFYFGLLSSVASSAQFLKFISDTQFIKPIRETVRLLSNYTPVYFYEFSYEGALGINGVNMDKPLARQGRNIQGVGHSEEVWYLFKRDNLNVDSVVDATKSDVIQSLWTNFAKFGDPTPNQSVLADNAPWPQSSPDNKFTYLDIGPELVLKQNPRKEAMEFWDELYANFGRGPYDTY